MVGENRERGGDTMDVSYRKGWNDAIETMNQNLDSGVEEVMRKLHNIKGISHVLGELDADMLDGIEAMIEDAIYTAMLAKARLR